MVVIHVEFTGLHVKKDLHALPTDGCFEPTYHELGKTTPDVASRGYGPMT